MRFLVEIEIKLPDELRAAENPRRRELLAAELERGVALRRAGVIEGIWRIPGGLRNVGIWNVADATELHELLGSLPLGPWLRAEVTPLAGHPTEHALEGDAGEDGR